MQKNPLELLKKVLPILINDPSVMRGYDISTEEIEEIEKKGEIPFEILYEVAWDNFFELCCEDLDITYEEGLMLRDYLVKEVKKDPIKIENLKKNFKEVK